MAELYAIQYALEVGGSCSGSDILIITDSRAALQSIVSSPSCKSNTSVVIAILRWLRTLQQRKQRVRFQWVPSHRGIAGNEMADSIASSALGNATLGSDVLVNYIHNLRDAGNAKITYKPCIQQDIQDWWSNYDSLIRFRVEPVFSRTPFVVSGRRKLQTCLHRLRVGKALTDSTLHYYDNSHSPRCETCESHANTTHLLLICRKYEIERNRLFKELAKRGTYEYTTETILSRANCDLLAEFLKECGLTDVL